MISCTDDQWRVQEDDEALARDIFEEVRRHGGEVCAEHLLPNRPELRKRLGDRKLLVFLRAFGEFFEIDPDRRGGHKVSCRGTAQLPSHNGNAFGFSAGLTAPTAVAKRVERDRVEHAVHVLRQLERLLVRRLAGEPVGAGPEKECDGTIADSSSGPTGSAAPKSLAFLLGDGNVKRKIAAVIRVLPEEALMVQDVDICTELVPEDESSGCASRSWCPKTPKARTQASYIMQFLRDRPMQFDLSLVQDERAEFQCIYRASACPCRLKVRLLSSLASAEEDDDREAVLQLVAKTVASSARGSTRVPISRLGRDPTLHRALAGRPLLRFIEADCDARAAKALPPRLKVEGAHSGFFTVALCGDWGPEVLGTMSLDAEPVSTKIQRPRNDKTLPLHMLCEASGVVALLKPAGCTTEALLAQLQVQYDNSGTSGRRVISVSRLDKDTSGVLVAATSAEGADCLTAQFKDRTVYKRYLALCVGRMQPIQGKVEAKLYISTFGEKWKAYVSPKGKEARTEYRVIQHLCRATAAARLETDELAMPLRALRGSRDEDFSLLECHPLTGRTHQIRAHLAWIGCPLVADATYLPRGQARSHFSWCPRLFLHCETMRVTDLSGKQLQIRAPLSEDLSRVLRDKFEFGEECFHSLGQL